MILRHRLSSFWLFPSFIFLFLMINAEAFCQRDAVAAAGSYPSYFYEPYPIKKGTYVLNLGGSFSLLPLPIMENEYPVPAVDIQLKWGILENISSITSLSTNIFGNLLHSGIQWNTHAGRFSFSLGDQLGGFYGFMTADQLFDDNTAYAIFTIPNLRMGYRFDKFSVSMTLAASYIFTSTSSVNGKKAPGPTEEFNDIFCTVAVEQPFLAHSYVSIGISLTYCRTPYQIWLMYNTFDQYLFIPEFFFSFQI